VTQRATGKIALAVAGIDQAAIFRLRDGVNGQIAPLQILLQRDVGREVRDKAGVAAALFALGARQRILFTAVRKKTGKSRPTC